jgi:hypothetical protein
MSTTFTIPEYTSLESGPVSPIKRLAANEAAAADELGELFSMAVASRIPVARVNAADVVIVPLVEPGEGQICDLSYLASVPFMFVRLDGPPQPIMSYGTCWAWSAGSENCGLVQGQRVKFPTVSHYIVARPEVVLGLEHEMRFKASREVTEAKRVCRRLGVSSRSQKVCSNSSLTWRGSGIRQETNRIWQFARRNSDSSFGLWTQKGGSSLWVLTFCSKVRSIGA